MSNINNTLLALSGTDLARLAIPKVPDINKALFGGDLKTRIDLMTKHANQISKANQIAITDLAPKISQIAQMIEQQNKAQVSIFQSFGDRIQSMILQQSKLAEKFKSIAVFSNPTLESIKTLSSFNAFERYRQAYEEFGGKFNPDEITEEEIEQTIEENREIIQEINTVVLSAETEGVAPGDTPALIFSFLQKRVPNLSVKTFSIIVLIFSTIILTYGLYSNYSTNKAIDEDIVPSLNNNTEVLQDIKEESEGISNSLDSISEDMSDMESVIEETQNSVEEIKTDIDEYMGETNDKLDMLFEEMQKINSEKK